MPSPVMAAIRVRQSRRWVTCEKAYRHHPPTQARKIAVDNSEDEIRQALPEKIPNKSTSGGPCKKDQQGLCIDSYRLAGCGDLQHEDRFRT
jgi:hypothetical protein